MTERQRELFLWLGWMLEIGLVDDIPDDWGFPFVDEKPSPFMRLQIPPQDSVSTIWEGDSSTLL